MTEQVSPSQFREAEGVEDWRILSDGACAFFRTGSIAEGAWLAKSISEIPGIDEHAPDIDLRPLSVIVRLVTQADDYFGMTQRDIEVARQVSLAARELGLTADPSELQSMLIIPGSALTAEVLPFWQAVLGYIPRGDSPEEDLVDRHGRGPAFWFERMEELRGDGGGTIHVAVWIPIEQAEARVAAALAAGGRMVRDEYAPTWWTLADVAGNEADIGTIAGRG